MRTPNNASRSERLFVWAICSCLVVGSGCKSWQEIPITPSDLAAVKLPATLRVTRLGQLDVLRVEEIRLPHAPSLEGASLLVGVPPDTVEILFDEIDRLERRGFSGWRTGTLITAGVVVAGGVVVILVVSAVKSAF